MLTRRENLLRVLRHQRPEWIPVTGHVDPYNQPSPEGMDAALREKLKKVEWCDESTVAFSRWLGLDLADFNSPPLQSRLRKVVREDTQDGADRIRVWRTPVGELREVERQARADGTSYRVEHLLKGPEDLPRLAALFEDEEWERDEALARKITARRDLIGDDGIVMLFLPGTPLGMLYRVFSGVETLAYLWADARPELQHLFEVMERNYLRQFRIAIAADADVLVGMDDTSSNCVSPAMFEACNIGVTNARADLCHAAGKFYFHHSCGLIRDLLPLYQQTRMDAVHAFSVPPIGDVTIAAGRPRLGDRISIYASLGIIGEPGWNPPEVRATIRRMYDEAQPGDHFLMGIAGFPHRTMEQTRFAVDCCREFGQL